MPKVENGFYHQRRQTPKCQKEIAYAIARLTPRGVDTGGGFYGGGFGASISFKYMSADAWKTNHAPG